MDGTQVRLLASLPRVSKSLILYILNTHLFWWTPVGLVRRIFFLCLLCLSGWHWAPYSAKINVWNVMTQNNSFSVVHIWLKKLQLLWKYNKRAYTLFISITNEKGITKFSFILQDRKLGLDKSQSGRNTSNYKLGNRKSLHLFSQKIVMHA